MILATPPSYLICIFLVRAPWLSIGAQNFKSVSSTVVKIYGKMLSIDFSLKDPEKRFFAYCGRSVDRWYKVIHSESAHA